MGLSELPPPSTLRPGEDEPSIVAIPPGPQSRTWLTRIGERQAPMGPRKTPDPTRGIRADVPSNTVVYASGLGSNVVDVDNNRYVDLAAGFGSLLLGHSHPAILRAIELQAGRLLQAMGDVHPADAKIGLLDRLVELFPGRLKAKAILGLSGADAVSAALKTAVLATHRPGVIAFNGAYHGLSYGPLAACGLRASYREPFSAQLNEHVAFVDYPNSGADCDRILSEIKVLFARQPIGAILVEPILGRGGCIVPPAGFLEQLSTLAHASDALLIADEIWTGLGRAGSLVYTAESGTIPDLICLGKGLGGGLPISACLGKAELMDHWSQAEEVVHTSTFSGAPLSCVTAIATLDTISRQKLCERSAQLGASWQAELKAVLSGKFADVAVRGSGLMLAIDLGQRPGVALKLQGALLKRGYIVSLGGGGREAIVLTPPLTIAEDLLRSFTRAAGEALASV